MNKLLLDESKAYLVEEELPAVELTGPIVDTQPTEEEVPPTIEKNAYTGLITDLIQKEWDSINSLNSVIATLVGTEYEDIANILTSLVDEKTIQIGMLTKASDLIDGSKNELMNQGIEQAENIISEPATKDLE